MLRNSTRSFCILAILACASIYAQPTANVKPNGTAGYALTCVDSKTGQPVPGVYATFAVDWVRNTGAHFHPNSPNHPNSGLSKYSGYTNQLGVIEVTLYASSIAETEIFSMHCQNQDPTKPDLKISTIVGYNGIYYNDHPEIWYQVGGGTTGHGDNSYNHWMTTSAAYGLYYATQDYLYTYGLSTQVAVNDMALPYGGKFDICQNWRSPHQFHDEGTAGDVRGNTGSYAIPVSKQPQFVSFCDIHGGTFDIIENASATDTDGNVADPNRHVHCQFGGNSSSFNPALTCSGQ